MNKKHIRHSNPNLLRQEEKQKCAEAIGQKFYVEEGYSAYFTAGLIGDMAWEETI